MRSSRHYALLVSTKKVTLYRLTCEKKSRYNSIRIVWRSPPLAKNGFSRGSGYARLVFAYGQACIKYGSFRASQVINIGDPTLAGNRCLSSTHYGMHDLLRLCTVTVVSAVLSLAYLVSTHGTLASPVFAVCYLHFGLSLGLLSGLPLLYCLHRLLSALTLDGVVVSSLVMLSVIQMSMLTTPLPSFW